MISLPIDPVLPEVVAALERTGTVVLEAPPGAGKTTRVPPAMLDSGIAGSGEIVVLQPRRLAARLAAVRVAEERGERPGETVGWQVRFEDVTSARTRIRFVTEGVLTRRLLGDPTLSGVAAVVLDEFHERHLDGDVAAALLKRLRRSRPELAVAVMSATLDAEPIAAWLGGAPRVRSEGRRFEVAIEHAEREDDRPLGDRVAGAVKRLVADGLDGDVLVFLPGQAEIRRAAAALAELASRHDLAVLPLHGELPPAEQDRAVKPAGRRKIVLSTNVAETSVTIDGIVAVVDGGLARVASLSPWSGIPMLKVAKVSKASAAQRAGRAGRTRPGRCLRLYTKHDHDARPEQEAPEIRRLDLAETVLSLRSNGIAPAELDWLEAPPHGGIAAAESLLTRLGALDGSGSVTPLGRRMLRFPVHPRQSRLILEAEARGAGEDGCLLAALIGERDVRSAGARGGDAKEVGTSDLLTLAELFGAAARADFADDRRASPSRARPGCERGGGTPTAGDRVRRYGLEPGAVNAVERVRKQLVSVLGRVRREAGGAPSAEARDPDEALRIATLAAYPDRVARRRPAQPGAGARVDGRNAGVGRAVPGDELVLAGGGSARLDRASVCRDADLLVCVDTQERRDAAASGGRTGRATRPSVLVRVASEIEPEWLLDLFPEHVREEADVRWNAQAERVESTSRLVYGGLVLEESKGAAPEPEAARVLAEAALARGPAAFAEEGELERFLGRIAFLREAAPDLGIPPLAEAEARAALASLCEGRRSFAELRDAGLIAALRAMLPAAAGRALEKLAPESLTLPGGRRMKVTYEPGKPPWIASRLQDFFGMAQGPRLADGRVAVVLHLLAPNQRDLQVTTDLAGFWDRHYPAIRKELCRKYPKHAWPEDPRTAKPPQPRGRR